MDIKYSLDSNYVVITYECCIQHYYNNNNITQTLYTVIITKNDYSNKNRVYKIRTVGKSLAKTSTEFWI